MIKRLSKYGVANRAFVNYYESNGWQLPIPLKELLSDKYIRYQYQIFVDFIATKNLGIMVTPVGFTVYVLKPDLLPEEVIKAKDILFLGVNEDTSWYLIAHKDVELPDGLKESGKLDAMLAFVKIEAIVWCMSYINIMEDSFITKN